ncbi:TPA: ribosome recycling factor [Candidatus Saccharibacteria bacterium]|nr:ribosome recycling factor [Candidatus Saccharibacteria bacterium]HIO87223.1 ribosome recycling factor [Candidatus Saccharibacteria bacterium]
MDGELKQAEQKMKGALEHLHGELKKIRTGRANPAVLDSVQVEAYGQLSPLQHVANVNAVDSQMLTITPFDPSNLDAITAAIRNDSSLGLNPADDGKVIRVPIPPLTEERRKEIAKQVGEKAEEAKISLRNARHDCLSSLKDQEKAADLTKDELFRAENKVGELIEKYQGEIDSAAKTKEDEIMTV